MLQSLRQGTWRRVRRPLGHLRKVRQGIHVHPQARRRGEVPLQGKMPEDCSHKPSRRISRQWVGGGDATVRWKPNRVTPKLCHIVE
uniref:Hematopoietic factor-like protein n=1 Tax=Macrobrachium rosenbergii TaxID=79674 RepID=A0A3G4YKI4_MACRS|nr:hematopoietic factor-like protein [Macrobrachium rosenbergii]